MWNTRLGLRPLRRELGENNDGREGATGRLRER